MRIARPIIEAVPVQARSSRALGSGIAFFTVVETQRATASDTNKTLLTDIDRIAAFAENREPEAMAVQLIAVVGCDAFAPVLALLSVRCPRHAVTVEATRP